MSGGDVLSCGSEPEVRTVSGDILLRPIEPADIAALERLVDAEIAGRIQVRTEGMIDVLALPGILAIHDGQPVAMATYEATGDTAELAAIVVAPGAAGQGLGGRLIEAVADRLRAEGVQSVCLVTTNDNLDALRLYQRHGFRLVEVRPGAVDRARSQKPEIPEIGAYGIPLRDELLLVRDLHSRPGRAGPGSGC